MNMEEMMMKFKRLQQIYPNMYINTQHSDFESMKIEYRCFLISQIDLYIKYGIYHPFNSCYKDTILTDNELKIMLSELECDYKHVQKQLKYYKMLILLREYITKEKLNIPEEELNNMLEGLCLGTVEFFNKKENIYINIKKAI